MCCVLVGYCSIDCNRCSSDMFLCIFFFKQKTAYEMRISDWSSDVCSSDVGHHRRVAAGKRRRFAPALAGGQIDVEQMELVVARADRAMIVDHEAAIRSEEHTSELQSLMRISYAVFCLKKKKNLRYTKKSKDTTQRIETHHIRLTRV